MARKVGRLYNVFVCNKDGLRELKPMTYRECQEYADRLWYSGYNMVYIRGFYLIYKRENGKTE